MHFLTLFLAFIQKLCLPSSHFPKINKRGVEVKAAGGGKFSKKIISGGGRSFGTREYIIFRKYEFFTLKSNCMDSKQAMDKVVIKHLWTEE